MHTKGRDCQLNSLCITTLIYHNKRFEAGDGQKICQVQIIWLKISAKPDKKCLEN